MTEQEALQEFWDNALHPSLKPEISEEAKAVAMKALEKQINHSNEWISVEDRLPEDPDTNVLVIASGKPRENISLENAYELASYSQDDGWILEMYPEFEDVKVTHWMPLPDPPEGVEP